MALEGITVETVEGGTRTLFESSGRIADMSIEHKDVLHLLAKVVECNDGPIEIPLSKVIRPPKDLWVEKNLNTGVLTIRVKE